MRMAKIVTKEILLDNYLDKKFVDMLLPLNTALSLLILPNYEIVAGFVTPNNRFRKIKSFLLTVILLIVAYCRLKTAIIFKSVISNIAITFIEFSVYYDYLFISCFYIFLFLANYMYSPDNVNIVVNLQKALRNMQSVDTGIILKRLKIWNWMAIVVIPVYYFSIFMLPIYMNFTIGEILNFAPAIYFDVHIMYTFRLMWIIQEGLKMWVHEMLRYKEILQELDENERIARRDKIFESYRCIFIAFDLFKKVCQVPVIMTIVQILGNTLMYLQVNIDVLRQDSSQSVTSFIIEFNKLLVMAWIFKNGLILFGVCYSCEQFYSLLEQAEEICNITLNINIPDDIQRLCKNVRRQNRAGFRPVRVCGLPLHSNLLLQIISVLAVHTAVVLQLNM